MKTTSDSLRSPGGRLTAALLAPSLLLLTARPVFSANIAGEGSPIMGLNDAADGDAGEEFIHPGQNVAVITDNNTGTYGDTFGNAVQGFSYAGVLWSAPRTDRVTVLKLTLATFGDGGWFGPNSTGPGPGNSLLAEHLLEPKVQTTADGGATWTDAAFTSNYLSALTGHQIGGGANPFVTPKAVTFTLGGIGVTGIDGVRILGSSGGNVDNGFLGVFELEIEATQSDSDGDGMDDQWEQDHGLTVGTNDGALDADGDGLLNLAEYQRQTDPQVADTDGDGLNDGPEVTVYFTDPTLVDTDGDTLIDGAEVNTTLTDPKLADTDGDGLNDGLEVNVYHSNPLVADTDGDGYTDVEEVRLFSDPNAAASVPRNIAPAGTGIIGTSTALEGGTDTPHAQAGVAAAVNDALYTSRVDTFGRNDPFAYVGVTWETPRAAAVDRLDLSMVIFRDGGWFGPGNAGPAPGGALAAEDLTAPTVQITTDGTTWTTVSAVSNYVATARGTVIPDAGAPLRVNSSHRLDTPAANIRGVRLIGPEGGYASEGFIGVWELGVGDVNTAGSSNIALYGSPFMGTSVDSAAGPDTLYSQQGAPERLTDGDYNAPLDTFGRSDPFAYAGIIWPAPRVAAVDRVEATFALFGDGGWFGPNGSSAPEGVLSHPSDPPVLEEPQLQVTTDGGATWTTEAHTSTYLTAMNGVPTQNGVSPRIVFALNAPRAGINGIRLIGSEGGNGSSGFLGLRELAVREAPASPPGNAALNATAVLGLNDAVDGDRGRAYTASGFAWNINDGDTASRVDTFDGAGGLPVSFASLFWPSGRAVNLQSLTLTMATFTDGGWFGPPGLEGMAPGGNLTAEFLTEPVVQTVDASGVWTTVAATSDYLTAFTGHGIGGGANPNPSAATATFTLTPPLSGVLGARIIGDGGGTASGGFIGVFELTAAGTMAAGGADADGDGQSDDEEAIAGTDPANPKSVLAISAVTRDGAAVILDWSSVSGKTYQVQTTADPAGVWTNLGGEVPASGGATTNTRLTLPNPGDARRFLRILVVP